MASFSKRGEKTLAQVRIMRSGVAIFQQSKTFDTRVQAEAWAKKLEAKIERDGVPSAASSRVTVGDLLERHLKYQNALRPLGRSAVHNYEYMASSSLAGVLAVDLTTKHIMDFASMRRMRDKVTPATILSNLSALSAAIHAAKHLHGVDVETTELESAMRRLKDSGMTSRSRQVDRMMRPEEREALMEEFALSERNPQSKIPMTQIFQIAIAFPRRASELTRMRWDDIDEAARTVVIRDVKHPTRRIGNDQTVPLLGPAWDLIQALPRTDPRILPYQTDSVCVAYERARDRAAKRLPGIKDLRFHDLRHYGITALFKMGFKIQEVALVSGHTSWVQLRRYEHTKPADLHERFDALIAGRA